MYWIGAAGLIKGMSYSEVNLTSSGNGMNVRGCAPSGGGCSSGRLTGVLSVATHDVCLGHAVLMAGLAQQACGGVVSNLDLVSTCPVVPDLAPSRFGIAPVGGADRGLHHWSRSCWCRRGWNSGGAHLCNGELDVGNGFGEHCVGGHQIIDGGILLNCHVHQIIKRRSHLLCLIKFDGLVCAKHCVCGCHSFDIAHIGKGSSPIGLPVEPSVVGKRATFPLAPCQHHVPTR